MRVSAFRLYISLPHPSTHTNACVYMRTDVHLCLFNIRSHVMSSYFHAGVPESTFIRVFHHSHLIVQLYPS